MSPTLLTVHSTPPHISSASLPSGMRLSRRRARQSSVHAVEARRRSSVSTTPPRSCDVVASFMRSVMDATIDSHDALRAISIPCAMYAAFARFESQRDTAR